MMFCAEMPTTGLQRTLTSHPGVHALRGDAQQPSNPFNLWG